MNKLLFSQSWLTRFFWAFVGLGLLLTLVFWPGRITGSLSFHLSQLVLLLPAGWLLAGAVRNWQGRQEAFAFAVEMKGLETYYHDWARPGWRLWQGAWLLALLAMMGTLGWWGLVFPFAPIYGLTVLGLVGLGSLVVRVLRHLVSGVPLQVWINERGVCLYLQRYEAIRWEALRSVRRDRHQLLFRRHDGQVETWLDMQALQGDQEALVAALWPQLSQRGILHNLNEPVEDFH
jgi:hypothetical protein